MFGLGAGEIALILLLGLLLFGHKLPNMARSVGRSLVEFKREVRQVQESVESASR